jgi:AraC-like DNA-binding protein
MSLTTETIQTTATVGIHLVRCQPKDHACGPVEYSSSNILVFPLRGVFLHHGGPRERVVADNCHALFFNALVARPEVEWRLDDLAKRVHSSPFHLSRTFRQCTGMPLHRYHLLARMAVALNEVMETSRELTAIALELGFSSHSHFTARFRQTFGMTPSALRSRAKRRQVAELSKILTAGTAARAMVEA